MIIINLYHVLKLYKKTECQDLNICQHKIVDKLIEQSVKRFICVGDKNQAIYGFSGASTSSFDLFLSKPNVKQLPLDICYRCDDSIIKKANEVYDVMTPFNSSEGIVKTITDYKLIQNGAMVICRNTNPLIELYFQLLAEDKNVYLKGEDILNSLIRFLKAYSTNTVTQAFIEMTYRTEELEKDYSEEGKIKFYVFKENLNNFTLLYKHFCGDYDLVSVLLEKLKSLFEEKENGIMLCTIHKSKGLESDVVYILNENLIPSKFAKSKEQLQQEQNLKYVARTRAKHELYFLNM